MQVADNKGRAIMFALGAVKFSEEVASKRFGDLKRPWFRLVPCKKTGRFSATLLAPGHST